MMLAVAVTICIVPEMGVDLIRAALLKNAEIS